MVPIAVSPERAVSAAPPDTYFDSHGRCRRRYARPTERRAMDPHAQLVAFVGWLREEGYHGHYLPEDLTEAYDIWVDGEAIEAMPHNRLLSGLGAMPGVDSSRPRLGRLMGCAIWRGLHRRSGGQEKPTIYRIASAEEVVAVPSPAKTSAAGGAAPARTGRLKRGRADTEQARAA